MNKLETMIKERDILNDQVNEICKKKDELGQKIFQAKIKEVFDSGSLRETKWEVSENLGAKPGRWNSFTLCGHNGKFKKLSKLLETDYHCDSRLEDKVDIHFDDGDIRIVFEDENTAFDFVKKHGLPLDLTGVEGRRDKYKRSYEALDKFLKEFKK